MQKQFGMDMLMGCCSSMEATVVGASVRLSVEMDVDYAVGAKHWLLVGGRIRSGVLF